MDGQNGWTTRDAFTTAATVGKWDQQVLQVNDANGNRKVFRMSNALASGTDSSQVFLATVGQVAGESNAAGSAPRPLGARTPGGLLLWRTRFNRARGSEEKDAHRSLVLRFAASGCVSPVRIRGYDLRDIYAPRPWPTPRDLRARNPLSQNAVRTAQNANAPAGRPGRSLLTCRRASFARAS